MCEISNGSVQWKELHNSDRRRYQNKRPVVDDEKGDRLGLDGQERQVFRTFRSKRRFKGMPVQSFKEN